MESNWRWNVPAWGLAYSDVVLLARLLPPYPFDLRFVARIRGFPWLVRMNYISSLGYPVIDHIWWQYTKFPSLPEAEPDQP